MTLVALSFYLPSCVTEIKHVVALVFILGWKKKRIPMGTLEWSSFPLENLSSFFFNLLNAISFHSDDEEERVLHQQQQQTIQ